MGRSLGYIAAGRHGLTEDELLDVLVLDDEVWSDLTRSAHHALESRTLPVVLWSRLQHDLAPYLTERAADGTSTLGFFHRQVGDVVGARYLGAEERVVRHAHLAGCFGAQPLLLKHAGAKTPHLRKLMEQPWQQTQGECWDPLAATLTDLAFLEAKAEAGLVFDLATDFRNAHRALPREHPWRRNLRLLEQAVRTDLQFLARRPTTVFQCLWNSAWWYDCAEAEHHCEPPEGGWGPASPLWDRPEPRLCTLLERWRGEKEARERGFVWLRAHRPPPAALGGAQLACLRGHRGWACSVAFSPDGSRIASGGSDKTVRVWDAESGGELACLKGHERHVTSVAFSPDGARIASGGDFIDPTMRVWDAESGRELACLRGHERGVESVAFSPDGARIASGSTDKTVRVWDAASGRELACLRFNTSGVTSVAFSADGTRLASGAYDRTVRVWDAQSGGELACLRGHKESVTGVAFSCDGARIASGSRDMTVRVWDAERLPRSRAGAAVISILASLRLRLGRARGRELACLRGHEGAVESVAFSPDGARIVSGALDFTVRVWAAGGGREQPPRVRGHESRVTSVALTPDGTRVVSGSDDSTVRLWDVRSGQEVACLRGHEGRIESVAISPDGDRIASGATDSNVRVWDAATGRELACLPGHTRGVSIVVFAPGGARIVSGAWDGTVRVWDAASEREVACLRGHESGVLYVAFSPDGARIASGAFDDTVRVWEAESGRELACLRGHGTEIGSVTFSPDGARITSECVGRALVWDAESWQLLEVVESWPDLHLYADAGASPWRAARGLMETCVMRSATPGAVASFPGSLGGIAAHSSGRTWAGYVGSYVAVFSLEGDPRPG